jgi:NAD+ synthase (glutamine-hydrolysing)
MINQKPATTDEEKWLSKMMYFSEFKRWQSPPILKISEHAFGRGRRVPIAKYSKQV